MNRALKMVGALLLTFAVAVCNMISIPRQCVRADSVLTSPLICVEGYQMKTNVTEEQGISFRTICKAPDKGSVITIDGESYTVTNLGMVYVKDSNISGNHLNDVLDKSYTVLNPVPFPQPGREDGFKYVGQKAYNGVYVSFGYIATDKGIVERQGGTASYVRTLTHMDDFVTNSLFVRAFVEAKDKDGNDMIIYGEKASMLSVASVAYKVYTGGLAQNNAAHEYLYDSVLHKLPLSSPYYIEYPIEYGWGEIVQPN